MDVQYEDVVPLINTHLEEQLPPGLPELQVFQALNCSRGRRTPAACDLLGDFNSDQRQYGTSFLSDAANGGQLTAAGGLHGPTPRA